MLLSRTRPSASPARSTLGALAPAALLFLTMCKPADIVLTTPDTELVSVTIDAPTGSGGGSVAGTGLDCALTGTDHSGTCTRKVPLNSQIIVAATPDNFSAFAGWTGACAQAATDKCLLSVTGPLTLAAKFDPLSVALTVQSAGGTGNGTVTGGGINCIITGATATGTCTVTVLPTATVLLTATPASGGHTFTHWVGACTSITPTCSLNMALPRIVAANFTAPNLLTVVSGGGAGSGSVAGDGITCAITSAGESGTCSLPFAATASATLTATAGAGAVFQGWGGSCSGTSPTCTLAMSLARTAVARFGGGGASGNFTLTASSGGGTGNGTVTGSGVSCTITAAASTGTCGVDFAPGTAVVLTEAPASGGHVFAGWGGGVCTGTAITCTVTMSQARGVTASFTAPVGSSFALAITSGGGNGNGFVTASNVNCAIGIDATPPFASNASGTCNLSLTSGTTILLTAAPASGGFTFVGWGGACSGATTTCTVIMSQARSVLAQFNAPSLADVQAQVLAPFCAGCHVSMNTAANSFAYLVGAATIYRQPGFPYPLAATYPTRVVAYDPNNSYILYQIAKQAGTFTMPQSATVVPNNLVSLLTNWIAGGALAINP